MKFFDLESPHRQRFARSGARVARRYAAALATLTLSLPSVAQVIVLNPQGVYVDAQFGRSCAGVADVNGDGFGDVLVGVPQEWTGAPPITTGAAYLYSATTGSVLSQMVSPIRAPGGQFGFAVAGISDINGDGRGDALVGAYFERAVYAFSGTDGSPLYTLTPSNPNAGAFGFAVSVIPDCTGDGIDDIAVGAPFQSGERGRVYVFSGATGTELYNIAPPDELSGSDFGEHLSGVGDVDGDGHGDILVGAPHYTFSYDIPGNRGRAYLFSGATGELIRRIESPIQPPWYFGSSLTGIPDLDGDGRDDYAVGAPQQSSPDRHHTGMVFVYSGGSGSLLYSLGPPPTAFDTLYFGNAVCGTADVDGDGFGDFVIGAPFDTGPGAPLWSGLAYVHSGRTAALIRTLASPHPQTNPQYNGSFGWGVSMVPEGGGRAPGIVVAARNDCTEPCPPTEIGRYYVFHSCAGDFNYDGRADSQDFFDYLNAFFDARPAADFNRSGAVDSSDFFDFLAAFFEGCP